MRSFVIFLFAVSAAFSPLNAFASGSFGSPPTPQPPMPMPSTAVAPNSFEASGQYYDGTPKGLRKYLETIRSSQPEVYQGLNIDVEILESRQSTSQWLGWGGLGIGGFLIIGSATFLSTKKKSEFTGEEYTETNMGLLAGGAIVALGGTIAGLIINPSREEMMETINKHNRLSPQKQLKWQLGLQPLTDGTVLSAKLIF
jgi:hypothetical protein